MLRLLLVSVCLLCRCGGDREAGPAGPDGTGGTGDPGGRQVVSLADSSLEAAVRAALAQETGDLLAEEAESLEELDASGQGITDVTGIEQLTNLRVLVLRDNEIADVSPLAGLQRLRYLDLDNNAIDDVAALAEIDSLEGLVLDHNEVSDPTPLRGLEHLKSLGLKDNPIDWETHGEFASAMEARGVELEAELAADQDAPQDSSPGWPLASGGKIAFASSGGSTNQLYVMEPDGSNRVSLFAVVPGVIGGYSWSPDGTRLAVAIAPVGEPSSDIYVLDGTTYERTPLVEHQNDDMSPAWSPDGEWIAFVSNRANDYRVYRVRSDGTDVQQLTFGADRHHVGDGLPADWLGSWSPDGAQIAFFSDSDGDQEVYVMDADGGNPTQLTDDAATDVMPVWSPDKEWIAFASDRGGDFGVYRMRPDGSGAHAVVDGPGNEFGPTWSPDGQYLAYSWDEGGTSASIYVVPAGGGSAVKLSASEGHETGPKWSPAAVSGFDHEPERPGSDIAFASKAVETAVRQQTGQWERLTAEDVLGVTELELQSLGVDDLEGMQYLTNLRSLDLRNNTRFTMVGGQYVPDTTDARGLNRVRDLTPLAGLMQLEELDLTLNPVEDLTPLSELKALRNLDVDWCPVSSLRGLSTMAELTVFSLCCTSVSDLAPLAGMPKLAHVSILYCQIKDISPLAEVPSLMYLNLSYNLIEDVAPLLDTEVVSVTLVGNPLSEESLTVHVPALRARHIGVYVDP